MSSRRGQKKDPNGLACKLRLLPDAPGVYLHKDKHGKVIYVGKAARLHQRVSSYFQRTDEHDPKTALLVRHISDVDYIATAGEAEALVLEDQLIKEYRPRYNIRLKDDKHFPYMRITLQEPYPRVEVVRRIADDGARYFGPYTNVRAMRETLKHALRVFQVRTCHLDLPEQTVPRPCLDWQIGRCSAPCVEYDTQAVYGRRVHALTRFLEGRQTGLLEELRAEMADLSGTQRYEDAARVRDRLALLESTLDGVDRISGLMGDLDACGIVRDGALACGVVLRVRGGQIMTTHHFLLEDRLENETPAFLAQLCREYFPRAGDLPPVVLVSHDLPDRTQWSEHLGELRGGRVSIVKPRRGPRREAVDMALANAAYKLNEWRLRDSTRVRRVAPGRALALQDALDLRRVPETLECFDISTLQGRETVASLVYFKGGQPPKSRYRRFRIRTVKGTDDYASMHEVLSRYYKRLLDRELPPADLVIVDGGAGQLAAARGALATLGLHEVELVGLAKREEIIHREHGLPPVRLPRTSPALQLLQRVRDEAHRFAITYHRLLRARGVEDSILDRIPGIGRVKKLTLLHHFDSINHIRCASAEELAAVRGIHASDVERIVAFFAADGKAQT